MTRFEVARHAESSGGRRRPTRFRAPRDGVLSQAMRAAYRRDGFVVLEGFLDAPGCRSLMARASELVQGFEPGENPTVFSTRSHRHAQDAYFLESGDKVRFFLEEDALDEHGVPRGPTALSMNKIGHALHDLDPTFAHFSRDRRIEATVRSLGVGDPLLLQSMYLFKPPRIGAEVVWHQDATFIHTEPSSVVGLWFALEKATRENGCLWALPGHQRGPLKRRFRRHASSVTMDTLDDSPWPVDEAVPLEVDAGTLVLLHGLLPHGSGPNRSAHSRQAYSLHVVDGRCRYGEHNWLRRDPELPLRGFGS